MSEPWYMLYAEGAGSPTVKHEDVPHMRKEAERLAAKEGKVVHVLKCVASVSVEARWAGEAKPAEPLRTCETCRDFAKRDRDYFPRLCKRCLDNERENWQPRDPTPAQTCATCRRGRPGIAPNERLLCFPCNWQPRDHAPPRPFRRPPAPWEIAREEMKERGMTEADLWAATGWLRADVRMFLDGKFDDMNASDFYFLARAFPPTTLSFWRNLYEGWREWAEAL